MFGRTRGPSDAHGPYGQLPKHHGLQQLLLCVVGHTKNWKKVNKEAYEALSECSTYFPLLNHGCGSDTCYLEADKFYTESIEGGTILDEGALDANSFSVWECVLRTCFISSFGSRSFSL